LTWKQERSSFGPFRPDPLELFVGAMRNALNVTDLIFVKPRCGLQMVNVADMVPGVGTPWAIALDLTAFAGTIATLGLDGELDKRQVEMAAANLLVGLVGNIKSGLLAEGGYTAASLGTGLATTFPELAAYETAARENYSESFDFSFSDLLKQQDPSGFFGGFVGWAIGQAAPAFGNQILDECGTEW
jgi:hypothetical protein